MADPVSSPLLCTREGLLHWIADSLECDVSEIGDDESLIELGLDSLSIMRLPILLSQEKRIVKITDLMKVPTLRAWEKLICQSAVNQKQNDVSLLPEVDLYQPFPLTDVQRAYWLGRQNLFKLGGIAAHGYLEVACGKLNIDRLQQALNRVIQIHPMLRMHIGADGLQRIAEKVPAYEIVCHDGEDALLKNREAMREAVLPADRWPLFDIRVTHLSELHDRLHIGFDVMAIDLTSLGQWLGEWLMLYETPSIQISPPETNFPQYVALHEEKRTGEKGQISRAWWEKRMDTLPPAPDLPLATDPATIAQPSFKRLSATLSTEQWSALKKQAARVGITPSTLVLASLAEVLAQWSRDPHFTLNLTLFDRLSDAHDFKSVLGDFTSLLLVEADLREAATFTDHARALQNEIWRGLDHAAISGVEVMTSLARRQGRSGENIMPVVFTSAIGIHSYLDAVSALGKIVYACNQTPQVWLDVQAVEHLGGIMLIWDCVDGLFPPDMLEAMFEAQIRMLSQLQEIETWNQAVPSLLPPAQQQRIACVNDTAQLFEEQMLFSPFLTQVKERPDETALITADRRLSYRELDQASTRLACLLQQKNVQPDTLVAVAMPRGWQQIVAVLGIVRSGCAYLPLDSANPAARLSGLIKQGEVQLVLTQDKKDPQLPEDVERIIIDERFLRGPVEPSVPCPAHPGHLAYVIFTSGSTGQPKGVMVEHRAALNTILDINQRHHVHACDRILGVSSLSFDLSVYDIFGTFAAGGTLILPPAASLPEPDVWLDLIDQHKVTLWDSVPALFRLMLDRADMCSDYEKLTSLRLIMCSGDWLPVGLAQRIKSLSGSPELVSMGGATEAAIWSISKTVNRVPSAWTSIPYGKPLANQRFFVLDTNLRLRPDWVPGDLFIAGRGLARGYWRNETLTQQAFFPHPQTREMLYRTGDTGRFLPDGDIEFLGRTDDQVKVNGLRLELGEVEAALSRCSGVNAAAVTVVHSSQRGDHLAAFVQCLPEIIVDTAELQHKLHESLPSNWVPTSIQKIDEFPLNRNGKIDRNALTEKAQSIYLPPATGTTPFNPSSETEQQIADIWTTLLGHEPVSIEQSFFDAGGTSLLVMNLSYELTRVFGRPIPVVALFQHASIATQAHLVAGQQTSETMTSSRRGKKRRNMQNMLAQARLRQSEHKGF